jgi:hypothetical protein
MSSDHYRIAGTTNLDRSPRYRDPSAYPAFQENYLRFQALLVDAVARRRALTLYKFGFGDYHFLKGQSVGSAAVGMRALSKPYEAIGHERFVRGASRCDYYACEIDPEHVQRCREVIDRPIDFPAEYCYASVANRWLLRTFAGSIGLVGAHEKLAVVRELMQTREYRDYLGLERFEDYVGIPQTFACDDLQATEEACARQLSRSASRIFLVGIGHVKSGLLHRLTRYARAVFLDVGQGIDALAGVVDTEKPFFGGWVNHRVEELSVYDEIDYLSYLPYEFVSSADERP